jgi:NAD(P)-dependent dehydrogenase (short-subunit alcohol dehydrogenase family)
MRNNQLGGSTEETPMARALTGRAALVTGAAGGFGREITRALLQAGACVMATDVSDSGLETLVRQMTSEGLASGLAIRHLDISDHKACAATVEAVWDRFQSLGILINNGALGMGVIRDDHSTNLVAIEEITPETWDRFMNVNLSGAWYLTRAAVPGMKRAGWGRIITITTSFSRCCAANFILTGPSRRGSRR